MIAEIRSYLPENHPWQDQIQYFATIDSTNTRARQLALSGASHGTVLIADTQTGGRGRRGRSFHSPAGSGIYMSILLRPNCAPTELMHLTCATAVAACDAVEASAGFRPGIKWTNDLVFGKRKLAGILTELVLDPQGRVSAAIIGIGINCTQQPQDFPSEIRDMAGSLSSVTGRPIDRAQVAAGLIVAMEGMSRILLANPASVLSHYRQDCITLGNPIRLIRGDEERFGTALDIDAAGGLVVRFEDGTIQTVTSGEVSVRGMYGYL